MSQPIEDMGDADGEGHAIKLAHFDDGTVILHSRNPDTGEAQRVVLLENQWRLLLQLLLDIYGREKCLHFDPLGNCRGAAGPSDA